MEEKLTEMHEQLVNGLGKRALDTWQGGEGIRARQRRARAAIHDVRPPRGDRFFLS